MDTEKTYICKKCKAAYNLQTDVHVNRVHCPTCTKAHLDEFRGKYGAAFNFVQLAFAAIVIIGGLTALTDCNSTHHEVKELNPRGQ